MSHFASPHTKFGSFKPYRGQLSSPTPYGWSQPNRGQFSAPTPFGRSQAYIGQHSAPRIGQFYGRQDNPHQGPTGVAQKCSRMPHIRTYSTPNTELAIAYDEIIMLRELVSKLENEKMIQLDADKQTIARLTRQRDHALRDNEAMRKEYLAAREREEDLKRKYAADLEKAREPEILTDEEYEYEYEDEYESPFEEDQDKINVENGIVEESPLEVNYERNNVIEAETYSPVSEDRSAIMQAAEIIQKTEEITRESHSADLEKQQVKSLTHEAGELDKAHDCEKKEIMDKEHVCRAASTGENYADVMINEEKGESSADNGNVKDENNEVNFPNTADTSVPNTADSTVPNTEETRRKWYHRLFGTCLKPRRNN